MVKIEIPKIDLEYPILEATVDTITGCSWFLIWTRVK